MRNGRLRRKWFNLCSSDFCASVLDEKIARFQYWFDWWGNYRSVKMLKGFFECFFDKQNFMWIWKFPSYSRIKIPTRHWKMHCPLKFILLDNIFISPHSFPLHTYTHTREWMSMLKGESFLFHIWLPRSFSASALHFDELKCQWNDAIFWFALSRAWIAKNEHTMMTVHGCYRRHRMDGNPHSSVDIYWPNFLPTFYSLFLFFLSLTSNGQRWWTAYIAFSANNTMW